MKQKEFLNIKIFILIIVLIVVGAGTIFLLRYDVPKGLPKESNLKESNSIVTKSNPIVLLNYKTPQELAKESNIIFEFQYPKGFSVSEGGYKTPGGYRFPSLSIKKDDGGEMDVIHIPGGMSTGPEITCKTQASSDAMCVEIQGRVIMTRSKDESVLKAFEIITSTFQTTLLK